LYAIQEFIAALAAATEGMSVQSNPTAYMLPKPWRDGRIILTPKPSSHNQGTSEIQIKYQSLNPAPQFRAVVDAARSVILAGGTMSPVGDFNALSRKDRI
jgi:Rad3-related DNA helicase